MAPKSTPSTSRRSSSSEESDRLDKQLVKFLNTEVKTGLLHGVPYLWLGLAGIAMLSFWGLTAYFSYLHPELRDDLQRKRLGIGDEEVMGPTRWSPAALLRSITTTSPSTPGDQGDGQHKLLTLKIPPIYLPGKAAEDATFGKDTLKISSLFIKQPDIQIQRPYTPLQSAWKARTEGEVDLLIKKYDAGEMGRYLHSLQPGDDQVEIRGWVPSWDEDYMPSSRVGPLEEIIFVSACGICSPDTTSELTRLLLTFPLLQVVGGTGIAPAYQLISSTLTQASENAQKPSPTFRLLYGAPSPSSLLLLPELQALQKAHPDRLQVDLWVEQDEGAGRSMASSLFKMVGQSGQRKFGGLSASTGQIGESDLRKALAIPRNEEKKRRAILVCGPDGMIEAIAGAKQGPLQGALQGALANVEGVEREEVYKL